MIATLTTGAAETARAREGEACSPRFLHAQRIVNEALAVRSRLLREAGALAFQPEPTPDLTGMWMESWGVPEKEIYRRAAVILRRIELNDIAASGGDFEGEWKADPADWPEQGATGESLHRLLGLQANLAREGRVTGKAYAQSARLIAVARMKVLAMAPARPEASLPLEALSAGVRLRD